MNRRNFLQKGAAIISTGSLLQQCTLSTNQIIAGSIVGTNAAAGHLLRDNLIPPVTEKITTGTVIIGGGVSGLSAARHLQQNGNTDFILVELDKETGGNAASGSNEVSAYPWGAHYVPIPNNDLKEYLQFLEECNVITGYNENKLPVINEYYLCFEPQERLYINGHWQEGLIPDFGVPPGDQAQVKKFLAQMSVFRNAKGKDGKDAFAIPVSNSSIDEAFISLDNSSMKQWLQDEAYTAPALHWYVNYCCRDDFGTDYSIISAWAGIHYFAGRKGQAANAPTQSVITWPEGNHWLVKQLRKNIAPNIRTNTVASSISISDDTIFISVTDVITKKSISIQCKHCIVATPQFAAAHLFPADNERKKMVAAHFNYQPWMVANITCNALNERNGAGLSWDNVLYQSKALGYVEATHQRITQAPEKKVLTYYYPLTNKTAKEERIAAQKRTFEEWVQIILNDLSPAHNNLAESIVNIDIWIWGHGMISPQKGFIFGAAKKSMQASIDNKIFFAHTDLSGISIFEEAFYQGIEAANKILQKS